MPTTPLSVLSPGVAARRLMACTPCAKRSCRTPPGTVAMFVTDQVPEPRAALVLACVLQLTDEGARFWWQYAADGGQAAAYCLDLHHLALGERDTAAFWHRQTDDVQAPPQHDRVAVRQQYMDRAISRFVGILAPAVSCWTTV
jgi:hypothetical protein